MAAAAKHRCDFCVDGRRTESALEIDSRLDKYMSPSFVDLSESEQSELESEFGEDARERMHLSSTYTIELNGVEKLLEDWNSSNPETEFSEKHLICTWNNDGVILSIDPGARKMYIGTFVKALRALHAFKCGFSSLLTADVLNGRKEFLDLNPDYIKENPHYILRFEKFYESFEDIMKKNKKRLGAEYIRSGYNIYVVCGAEVTDILPFLMERVVKYDCPPPQKLTDLLIYTVPKCDMWKYQDENTGIDELTLKLCHLSLKASSLDLQTT